VWATLFALVMWDVLFSDVPGAFRQPFQSAPLDLGTPCFFAARRDAIAARLADVRRGSGRGLLRAAWEANHGALCRGVDWQRHREMPGSQPPPPPLGCPGWLFVFHHPDGTVAWLRRALVICGGGCGRRRRF
jgi:hypothetical protein